MSALSPFQFLLLHVVQLIVNHVAGSSRVAFDGVDANSYEYRMLLNPLLWVCHNFRAVAYSRHCNNFELNLSGLSFDDLDYLCLLAYRNDVDYRTVNYLGYSTHHSAKDITIFLDERSVYSSKALEAISRAPYDGCCFPLARKLAFIFVKEKRGVKDRDFWNDPLVAGTNIGAFVERIKETAPLVNEIRVQPSDRDDMPSIASEHFSDLASRLYQLTSRVEYVDISHIEDSTRLKPETICNLSLISYTSGSSIGNVH
ncbi:hypothetical protein GGI17_006294 [Coemansia sp. S146]|nr:hypothetical protein GGI17_006294 [Coemansia sp. S146]